MSEAANSNPGPKPKVEPEFDPQWAELTPSWEEIVPLLIAVVEAGEGETIAYDHAKTMLVRMSKLADKTVNLERRKAMNAKGRI